MYIKEFKKTTRLQGFTFQRGFKALISSSGRVLAATSGFAIHQGPTGSRWDPDDYSVRYYLQGVDGEWFPVNENLAEVWEVFGNRPESGLLYKMLRQGAEEEVAWLERLRVEEPHLVGGEL